MSLVTILTLSFVGSILAWRLAGTTDWIGGVLVSLLPAGLFAAFLTHWGVVTADGAVVESLAWVPSLGIEFGLRLNGFSLLFSLLITGIGALVTLYAAAYFAETPSNARAKFIFLILLFMASMLGTVLSDNLVVMFVFWEMTSLTSFMLIGFESTKPEARRAALQSLLVTAGGGLALFAAILLIGMELGTFSLSEVAARSDEIAQSPYLAPIISLLLLGAFTKSAQFPFHFWLPQAMAAPTPASAYLHSATMVKLGVYLLARFDPVRERVSEIEPLIRHYVGVAARRMEIAVPSIDDDVLEAARRNSWRGNIRELVNRVERAVALCENGVIDMDGFWPERAVSRADGTNHQILESETLATARESAERQQIQKMLVATQGHIQEAAQRLGVSRTTLWEKMRRYGLESK